LIAPAALSLAFHQTGNANFRTRSFVFIGWRREAFHCAHGSAALRNPSPATCALEPSTAR